MDKVDTLVQAKGWFLSHSEGRLILETDNKQTIVETYLEAEVFFTNN